MSESFSANGSPLTRAVAGWNAFWFSPQDPTVLGLMRILVGLVTLYTFLIHGLTLPEFMGEQGWYDGNFRREMIVDRPIFVGALLSSPLYDAEAVPQPPTNKAQHHWANKYKELYDLWPPAPHAETESDHNFVVEFRKKHGFDFRFCGLPFPKNDWERKVLVEYAENHFQPFAPPYPANDAEKKKIEDYFRKHEYDPRRLYARGIPAFSVWLDVVDPFWMNVVQSGFTVAAFCFVVGLGTRVSSVIVWFASLCYIHRNPAVLFGVDTMMNVLLLYLMIGPSGGALSIDRLISRWWNRGASPIKNSPRPCLSANLAIRLLQVHLCIIYFIAGIAKLQGQSWWTGTAVWSVLANYEFAPMQVQLYTDILRFLGRNQLLFDSAITGACFFTLAFELSYPFLIWRPSTRWLLLVSAVFLHGFIGMFMGLKTFSLMMLIFNMAFLRAEEITWLLRGIGVGSAAPTAAQVR